MSSSPPLKKRNEGPRSKNGCGTCKDRKKKCDEQFDVNGQCDRCKTGGFACRPDPQKPSRSRRSESTNPPSASAFTLPDFIFPPTFASHHPLGSPSATNANSGPALNLSQPSQQTAAPLGPAPVDFPSLPTSTHTLLDLAETLPKDLSLSDGLSWEKLLSQLEQPSSALAEIRTFAEEWWNFYSSLNDVYFGSIPRPVRNLVKEQMRVLCACDDLGRAALSAWCASSYSRVLLKEGDERHVEFEAKASKFYNQALELLQDRTYPLHIRINAILDMRLSQMDGASEETSSPLYFLLSVGEFFILEECGPHPAINLDELNGSESIAIRSFAYLDVFRTIFIRGRKTIFDFTSEPTGPGPLSPAHQTAMDLEGPDPVTSEALSVHLGLPVRLCYAFAAISNLAVDAGTLDPQEFKTRADKILADVKGWKSAQTSDPVSNSAQHISDLATQEIWRHACLIYFYSSLLSFGPLATPLRHSVKQIIQLSHALSPPDPGSSFPSVFLARARAPAWFLVATCAVTEDERELCREHLAECGEGKVWRGNVEVVEKIWALSDGDGRVRDWREECERNGWVVAFL